MKQPDLGSILAAGFVAFLAIGSNIYEENAMVFIRSILEKGHLNTSLVIIVLVIVITHAIKIRPQNSSNSVFIRSGLIPLDIVLTLSTYIAVSTTACALLEGAFIQKFYHVVYFTKFSVLDIYVLMGVSALLIWYVLFHMYKLSIELFFPSKTLKLSSADMHKKQLVSQED
ncbi:hypothetical protein [Aliivibrio sp. SR45-2]|uniref:hypothetical protein n=1 Tax=Aliivibrio TaxID=511678 RepID=UPI0015FAF41C|nr:hypothetical protein [Aliivibrio sp. SR45-2]MBB1315954.1 hypothetical protein [Aliivibrio sp. SR45-2]